MSEFDDLYREVILDHYKSPRHYGRLESPDGEAEGQNPLCGDELSISVAYEGDTISDIRFEGAAARSARRRPRCSPTW